MNYVVIVSLCIGVTRLMLGMELDPLASNKRPYSIDSLSEDDIVLLKGYVRPKRMRIEEPLVEKFPSLTSCWHVGPQIEESISEGSLPSWRHLLDCQDLQESITAPAETTDKEKKWWEEATVPPQYYYSNVQADYAEPINYPPAIAGVDNQVLGIKFQAGDVPEHFAICARQCDFAIRVMESYYSNPTTIKELFMNPAYTTGITSYSLAHKIALSMLNKISYQDELLNNRFIFNITHYNDLCNISGTCKIIAKAIQNGNVALATDMPLVWALINKNTYQLKNEYESKALVTAITFINNQRLAIGYEDGKMIIVAPNKECNLEKVQSFLCNPGEYISAFEFNPKKKLFSIAYQERGTHKNMIECYNQNQEGKIVYSFSIDPAMCNIKSMILDSAAKLLALYGNHELKIYELKTKKVLHATEHSQNPIRFFCFTGKKCFRVTTAHNVIIDYSIKKPLETKSFTALPAILQSFDADTRYALLVNPVNKDAADLTLTKRSCQCRFNEQFAGSENAIIDFILQNGQILAQRRNNKFTVFDITAWHEGYSFIAKKISIVHAQIIYAYLEASKKGYPCYLKTAISQQAFSEFPPYMQKIMSKYIKAQP